MNNKPGNMDQKDIKDKVVLNYIGTCPVCGKGRMLQGSAGWTCNHFKDWEDKCSFTIFGMYSGHVVTEEEAVSLITEGRTGVVDLMTKDGKPYRGFLKIEDDKVKVSGVTEYLDTECPACGGKVRKVKDGWACINTAVEKCKLFIPSTICSRHISPDEVRELLEKGRTEVLDGFVKKDGKTFSSCLVIEQDGSCRLDGRICRCPKCGGDVYAGSKGYNCSNFRNKDIRCDFVIWRNIHCHAVTVDEVRVLCGGGRTGLLDFKTQEGGSRARSMMLDDNYKVRLI